MTTASRANPPLWLALVFLSACAGTPPMAPGEPSPPAQWAAAPAAGPGAAFPSLVDAPLAALLAQAEHANRDLAQAALRLKQAQTQAQMGALRWAPSAGLSYSASRAVQAQPPARQAGVSRSYSASASAGYEWDLWDRLAQGRAALAAGAEAANADIAAARLLVRTKVANGYWQLAAAMAQRPLALAQQAAAAEVLARVKARVGEGKLLPIEADRAAAARQQAQVRLADLDAEALLARQQLALLLDQPAPGPNLPAAQLPAQPWPNWAIGSPADMLARHPGVQRARWQLDAALARRQASRAERYPRLSFSAGVGTGGAQAADWLKQPLVSLAANLVVPLIDWQRLDLQEAATHTEWELAALALRDAVSAALAEVEQLLIEAERLQQQLAANTLRLQEAQTNERQAALRHEMGVISRADWLQVQTARLDAEQGRIQLLLRGWQNRAALARALAL